MLMPDPAMATGERLKVLDFGLAKLSEVREAEFVKTNSQAVLGTPLYMSPEQCEGAGRVDAKTDVYALGCILYEMLAGRPPFLGDGTGQVIGQHLFKEPAPLASLAPQLPAALCELVARLLAKAKSERPSMREAQKALEALAEALPPPRRREAAESSGGLTADTLSAIGFASTLGREAGEPGSPQAKRRPTRLIASAIALSVLAGSFVAARRAFVQQPGPPALTPSAVAVLPAAPKQVTTRVDSEPPGALVIAATENQLLGTTPWQRQSEPQAGKLELTLRLAGHSDQSIAVSLSSDDRAYVALTPQPAAGAATAAASRSTSAARPAHKPIGKRISAPFKKLAGKIASKLKRKPARRPAAAPDLEATAAKPGDKSKTH